jgi:hypothetical protein
MSSNEHLDPRIEPEPEINGYPVLDYRRDFTPSPHYMAHVLQFVLLLYSQGVFEEYEKRRKLNRPWITKTPPIPTFRLDNPIIEIVAHVADDVAPSGPIFKTSLRFYLDQYHHFRKTFENAKTREELLYALDLVLQYTVLVANELLDIYISALDQSSNIRNTSTDLSELRLILANRSIDPNNDALKSARVEIDIINLLIFRFCQACRSENSTTGEVSSIDKIMTGSKANPLNPNTDQSISTSARIIRLLQEILIGLSSEIYSQAKSSAESYGTPYPYDGPIFSFALNGEALELIEDPKNGQQIKKWGPVWSSQIKKMLRRFAVIQQVITEGGEEYDTLEELFWITCEVVQFIARSYVFQLPGEKTESYEPDYVVLQSPLEPWALPLKELGIGKEIPYPIEGTLSEDIQKNVEDLVTLLNVLRKKSNGPAAIRPMQQPAIPTVQAISQSLAETRLAQPTKKARGPNEEELKIIEAINTGKTKRQLCVEFDLRGIGRRESWNDDMYQWPKGQNPYQRVWDTKGLAAKYWHRMIAIYIQNIKRDFPDRIRIKGKVTKSPR